MNILDGERDRFATLEAERFSHLHDEPPVRGNAAKRPRQVAVAGSGGVTLLLRQRQPGDRTYEVALRKSGKIIGLVEKDPTVRDGNANRRWQCYTPKGVKLRLTGRTMQDAANELLERVRRIALRKRQEAKAA